MIELLNIIFQDFSHYIGTIFLILCVSGGVANIFKNIKLININRVSDDKTQPAQPQVNQNVFNDILTLWNKKNGDNNKK